jgi:methionyl-tRNA synthetase
MDGNYCPHDQRFLPDRFIKGTCPKCKSPDQYGDVCEKCGATYAPTDLIDPFCTLCHTKPERRPSRHAFFKLSQQQQHDFLRTWIDSGTLQADVANYVRGWLDGGLKDWCITRDGPYFGFPVPDMENKYFYVWLDAPFGYMASSIEWGQKNNATEDQLWRSPDTRIEHIIGKDIMYFHTLFWPAVLNSLGYTLPSKVHVHGMLTVDGEKMSKSRGTFIRADVLADHVDPQALRYYFATKFTPESKDLDLSLDDMVHRVNAEMVNKYANLFSRVGQFVTSRLEGRLGALPFTAAEAQQPGDTQATGHAQGTEGLVLGSGGASHEVCLPLARRIVQAGRRIENAYRARDIAAVTRELSAIAEIGNAFMQAQKPWDLMRTDVEAARGVCTFVTNICQALAMYLGPIVPRMAEAGAACLGVDVAPMDAGRLFALTNVDLRAPGRLFERLERAQMDQVLEASKSSLNGGQAAQEAKAQESSSGATAEAAAIEPIKDTIAFDDFAKVDLRVGTVLSVEAVPKSKKLLKLMVDLGEGQPRQILSGIAQQVDADTLTGQQVVVVANLKPAKIMGLMSHGMIVAADGPEGTLSLIRPSAPWQAGSSIH